MGGAGSSFPHVLFQEKLLMPFFPSREHGWGCGSAVRNLRTNLFFLRVKEAEEFFFSSHVGRDDRNAYEGRVRI